MSRGYDLICKIDNMRTATGKSLEEVTDVLEAALLTMTQADSPVYHHFSPGLYVREVRIPAGTLAMGHRQKTRHLNIFLKGKVTMLMDGGEIKTLEAPMLFTGEPGRKFGYVHEDVVWLNVYPTEERDIETLEATYLAKSENYWQRVSLNVLDASDDREDYLSMLAEYGYDEATVRAQSEIESDLVPFPEGTQRVGVFDSNIEGKGLFATADIAAGDLICPARIGGSRTPAGRYTNHSARPNAEMVRAGNNVHLVALRDIPGCRGGFKGDEITVDYRKALELKGVKPCPVS